MNKKVLNILATILITSCCLVSCTQTNTSPVNSTGTVNNGTQTSTPVSSSTNTSTGSEVVNVIKQTPVCSPMLTGSKVIYPDKLVKSTNREIASFTDTFDSNVNEWALGPSKDEWANMKAYIQNGKYCIDFTAKKGMVNRDTVNSQPIANFDMQVEGSQASGTNGGADFDLVFRHLDSMNYYLFGVDQNKGIYYLAVKADSKWTNLIHDTKSKFINPSSANIIRVVAKDDNFDLYINGNLVNSIIDDTITKPGLLGIAVGLDEEGQMAIMELDNFSIKIQ